MANLHDAAKLQKDYNELIDSFVEAREKYSAVAIVAIEKGSRRPVAYYSCHSNDLPLAAAVLLQYFHEFNREPD